MTMGKETALHFVHRMGTDALEGKAPQRWPQKRLGRRLEEVAEAVGGGYCRLQMPLSLELGVRGTVAGRRLGALEGGGGGYLPPPSDASLYGTGLLMAVRESQAVVTRHFVA